METIHNEDTLELKPLLQKVRAHWYYFAISLVLVLSLAYVYNQYSQRKYNADAMIILENRNIGSTSANELVTPETERERGAGEIISLGNEISKLTSYNLIRSALQTLDFNVTYYTVEKFWPGFIKSSWLNEKYGSFPFKVTLDSTAQQITDVPVYVTILPDNRLHIRVQGSDVSAYNFSTDNSAAVPKVNIDKVINIGKTFEHEFLSFQIDINKNATLDPGEELCFMVHSPGKLVSLYQGKLTVEPGENQDKDARILRLLVEDNVPSKGINFLNALIHAYRMDELNKKNERGRNSIQFVEKQITGISDSLKSAELALQNFKASSSIVDIDVAKSSAFSRLGTLESEKAALEDKLSYYQSTLNNLQNNNANNIIVPAAAGIDDALFNDLIPKYIEKTTRLQSLKFNMKEENPLTRQLQDEIQSLREFLIENLTNAIAALRGTLGNTQQRIYGINTSIKALPQDERKIAILQRDYEYYSQRYKYLVDKKSEAELALATNQASVEVIDDPRGSDSPTWPKKGLIYALSFVLGMVIPLAFVILKDSANNNVLDKAELEKRIKAPLLGTIANSGKETKLVVKQYPNSAVAESFKFARINLQYFHQNGAASQVIGVTSSISGEGKTFCAANLSATFAESGKKTLLIGGDLRKPKLNEYFHLREIGLTNYIEEKASLEDIIQASQIKNLHIIAPGKAEDDPIKIFEHPNMDKFITEAKLHYDVIIFDTPPIGYVADYFVLLKYFDINIFVVRFNYTNKNILYSINDVYNNNKVKNMNILFNDVKLSPNYGYGYLDGYGQGYYTDKKKAAKSEKHTSKIKKLF